MSDNIYVKCWYFNKPMVALGIFFITSFLKQVDFKVSLKEAAEYQKAIKYIRISQRPWSRAESLQNIV